MKVNLTTFSLKVEDNGLFASDPGKRVARQSQQKVENCSHRGKEEKQEGEILRGQKELMLRGSENIRSAHGGGGQVGLRGCGS